MFEVLENNNSERKVSAIKNIKVGSLICTFSGKPIDYKKTTRLGNKESFAFQIEKDLYIYLNEPYRYFNHSCEPNCGVTPDLSLVAIKPIAKGEELRYDYSTTMMEHHWTMKCTCKSPSCRKLIEDFIKIPKITQKKYIDLNIVQQFILNSISYGRVKSI